MVYIHWRKQYANDCFYMLWFNNKYIIWIHKYCDLIFIARFIYDHIILFMITISTALISSLKQSGWALTINIIYKNVLPEIGLILNLI